MNTLAGTVHVYLPDDMAAGDTISGTIMVEPKGATEEERAGNSAVLRGTVIEIGGERTTASESSFRFRAAATGSSMPIVFLPGSGARSAARAKADLSLASPEAVEFEMNRVAGIPGGFDWPAALQQNSLTTVKGSFDGDAANTRLLVGGNERARLPNRHDRLSF